MEVKPGYKLTEVGVIPGDWEVFSLACHFRIYAGGDVPKHSVSQSRSATHPYPIFANALQDRGLYGFTNERRATADSLTITARGYLGHAEYRDEDFFPIVRLLVLEPSGTLDARFTTFAVNERVKFAFESTGVPQLTAPQVGKYSVAAPPLPEQRTIAAALSDVDALLAGLDRLIAKKRDLKQAAMQKLLTGQTRLPGFHGEWGAKRLADVCEIGMGRTPSRLNPAFWGGGYVWLSIADLRSKVVSQSKEQITELAASTMTMVPKGTLLMSFKLSIGRLCFAGCDLFTNEAICNFKQPQVDTDYLYYSLGRTDFSLYGKQAVKGVTLNKESLNLVEVHLPSLAEQAAIASVLSDMDAELAALETRRDKTLGLKQAMMQELLTGRTRLI